jgi:hypothetical protein
VKSLKVILGEKGKPPQNPDQWVGPKPRRPVMAGPGRPRKIAILGGAESTLKHAPWHDSTWELWSHASCRHKCEREPDVLFDLHPPELWRNPSKKFWDRTYVKWLKQSHIPIYMQDHYKDIPASIRYPFETMITEFPKGYMTNHVAYMMALALMEGVTHIGLYGCHYDSNSEYGPQRGCAEYWCGVAEGRGVQVLIPPGCDLLMKPSLLYGYQSHPDGKRDPSYSFFMGPKSLLTDKEREFQKQLQQEGKAKPENRPDLPVEIVPLTEGGAHYALATPPDGEAPALARADVLDPAELIRLHNLELTRG